MACGLFGKLPVKRDFIAVNTPREFMVCWEQWLQGGISASKIALTNDWLPAYLSAPLWRFWLGAGICGLPVAGAFMSSVDGVGRHFPLTAFDCGQTQDFLAMPPDPANDAWCDCIENFLLSALEPDTDYAVLTHQLDLLPLSPKTPAEAPAAGMLNHYGGMIGRSASVGRLAGAFESIDAERKRSSHLNTSFWWTIGGEGYEPAVIVADGLPDPNILTAMLTGKFEQKAM